METKEGEFIYSNRRSKNQPFDKRLIEHIVELAEQGVPSRDLLNDYGMNPSTLVDWMSKYGSAKSRRKHYTTAEKRTVIRSIEEGMSIKQAQIAFKISYPSVIRSWMKRFKEENDDLNLIKAEEVTKEAVNPSDNTELEALKKALEEANLKIRALDTMIDIAEEQLKIDIRKKSGARQSSK